MKKYQIKVYQPDGTLIKNVDPGMVMSNISFNSQINGGQGELSILLNMQWDNPESWTNPFNFVKVYVLDPVNPLGRLIYAGFISQRVPTLDGKTNTIEIVCLGLVSLLALSYYKNGASFDITHTAEDPGAVVEAVIDHFQGIYPGTPEWIGYEEVLNARGQVLRAGGNVNTTGSVITKDFSAARWADVLDEMVELAGADWFWHIDQGGDVHFKEKPATATHVVNIGKAVQFINPAENTEDIKNAITVEYDGGTTAVQEDAASITAYGRREKLEEDNDITDGATALIKAQTILNDLKSPKVEATIELNSFYDYESIKPGDTVRLRNYKKGSVILGDNMKVVSMQYTPNLCKIELEGRRYDMSKELKTVAN